ncbi:MAG: CoA transferase [Dehalococcoidia bacterium]|nr:CoA transferase [Dehalococcoidia bacterium]
MERIEDQGGDGLLAGTRVIDLSDGVAGAFGTRFLAGFGADVIKVEPPGGDPTRTLPPRLSDDPDSSVLFAYLNTGKRSIVVDTASSADREFLLRLLRTADVIVESAPPGRWDELGIDFDALRQEHPGLVVCSVTPFGQDGPRAGWQVDALTAFAPGGQMMLCGDDDKPPLKTAGHQAEYQAGLHVFASCATALFGAQTTGNGDHIDLSIQEAQAACLEGFGPAAMVRGTDSSRVGNSLRAIWGIYTTCRRLHRRRLHAAAVARGLPLHRPA